MKYLKTRKCLRGVWVEREEIFDKEFVLVPVFTKLRYIKGKKKSHDLIQARCQRLERKTLRDFSKTHRIGQLNANCETQRLVLIHSSCLEESLSLSKFQEAHIFRTS